MSAPMASQGSLGNNNPPNGGGIASTAVGTDSLSSQLAGMSKHQLYQIVSQMKDLIHQNQQQARQILIANPQLTKTLFQAQIMLGMVRAPDTPPPAIAPVRPPQQPPVQSQAPEVPPTPPPQSAAVLRPLPNQQPTPQQGPPPQMASPYLQQSQVSSAAVQPNQPSFPFQQSVQPHQQTSPLTSTMPTHSQPLAASTLQPPLQHGPPQPPMPSHPPPLPQQPRPFAPPQMQHPHTQGISFATQAVPVPQSYQPQSPYLQQGGLPQTNAGPSFQQMLAPPLPSQPPPQQMFQVPRSGNVNISSSGILSTGGTLEAGRGLSMGTSSPSAPLMTWNQAVPSSVPMVTPVGVAGHMVPGQHPFGGTGLPTMAPGLNPNPPQVFNQAMAQPQPPQQLQHQPQAFQMQMPIELEQQKALLQQVMNLTPEQINSLPPEQRQQVLQLQQAFRSQTG